MNVNPTAEPNRATLAELARGDRFRVVSVRADQPAGHRILEMGVTPGVEARVLGFAPLGDPIEIEVRGYRLSLRLAEAALVLVERVPADA